MPAILHYAAGHKITVFRIRLELVQFFGLISNVTLNRYLIYKRLLT